MQQTLALTKLLPRLSSNDPQFVQYIYCYSHTSKHFVKEYWTLSFDILCVYLVGSVFQIYKKFSLVTKGSSLIWVKIVFNTGQKVHKQKEKQITIVVISGEKGFKMLNLGDYNSFSD